MQKLVVPVSPFWKVLLLVQVLIFGCVFQVVKGRGEAGNCGREPEVGKLASSLLEASGHLDLSASGNVRDGGRAEDGRPCRARREAAVVL